MFFWLRRAALALLNWPDLPVLHHLPGVFALKSALSRWCGLKVGRGVIITPHLRCAGGTAEIVIEDHAVIGNHTSILNFAPVHIGRFARVATDVVLSNGAPGTRREPPARTPLSIGRGCWIGAGATIVGPVTIGDFSIIGAGSLVTHDVPACAVVFGVPARAIWKRKLPERIWYMPGRYFDPRTFEFTA